MKRYISKYCLEQGCTDGYWFSHPTNDDAIEVTFLTNEELETLKKEYFCAGQEHHWNRPEHQTRFTYSTYEHYELIKSRLKHEQSNFIGDK